MKKSQLKQLIREVIQEWEEDRPANYPSQDTSDSVDPLNPPPGNYKSFKVYIPANVYDGKFYDYQTYPFSLPVSKEIKSEQDAIRWVNSHKQEVLKKIDRAKRGGKRYVKLPLESNVFFKDTYPVVMVCRPPF